MLAACTFNIFAEPMLIGAQALSLSDKSNGVYDFSEVGDSSPTVLAGAELLEMLAGEELSAEEERFVNEKSTLTFSYSPNVPVDNVLLRRPDGDDSVFVLAREYSSASTKNGIAVTWIPKTAALGNETAQFLPYSGEGDFSYRAELPYSEEERVSVSYTAEFTFSKEAVNEICTLAYKSASSAVARVSDENEKYEALLAEYDKNCALRRDYLVALAEYETALSLYEAYIAECERITADYNKELSAYNELLSEYEKKKLEYERLYSEYQAKLEEYNTYINITKPAYDKAYAEYDTYLKASEKYENDLLLYEDYLKSAVDYLYQLDIINTAKVPMTLGRTLYDAVMGTTVTQVLDRANEIKDAIPDGAVPVTRARQATVRLRNFFNDYFSATTDEGRYICYSTNYSSGYYLKKSFTELLQALDFLYKVDAVYKMLAEQDKSEKYVILLSQLYVITTALSDEPVYNYEKTTQFTDSYKWTYVDSAGKKHTVTPIQMLEGKRYLTDKDAGTPLSAPFPEEVAKPVKPEEVLCPSPVEKVTEPIPPKTLEPAPKAPKEPTYPEEIKKPVCPDFVPEAGDEPEAYIPTDEETFLIKGLGEGKFPKREELTDDLAIAREAVLEVKVTPDDSAVVYFYNDPADKEPLYVVDVKLGERVIYEGETPKKFSDEDYHYSFLSWAYENGEPANLENIGTGHIYLYPVFKKYGKNESYAITWKIDGKSVVSYFKYNEIPVYDGIPAREKDGLYYYEFSSWDKEPEPVSGEAEYTAIFTPIRYYKIQWLVRGEVYAETECVEGEIPLSPSTEPSLPDDAYGRYSFSGWEEPAAAFSDASYEAKFDVTRYYKIDWRLGGQVIASTSCLETEKPVPPISVGTVLVDNGSVKLILAGWSGELVAPSSDTFYDAEYTALEYHRVRFMVFGNVIESKYYLEGTMPVLPSDPEIPDKDGVRYTFLSWDKEISPVSGDVDYTAVFDEVKLYRAVWKCGGETLFETVYAEGEVPSYGGKTPVCVDDKMYKYSFSGWDKEALPISEDIVFFAEFSREYIYPVGTSGAELTYGYGSLTVSLIGTGACEINDFEALVELSDGRSLIIKTDIFTLEIASEVLLSMKNDGVKIIRFSSPDDVGLYFIEIEDEVGAVHPDKYALSVGISLFALPESLFGGVMHLIEGTEASGYVIKSVALGSDTLSVESFRVGIIYKYVEFFEINVSAGAEYLSVKTLAAVGERVKFELQIPEGMKLLDIYYIKDGESGERFALTGDEFIMPSYDVRLSLAFTPEIFSVKFVLFGGVEIVRKCEWGTLPTEPEPPRGSDSEYIYTFLSWDKEITPAFADAVYTAEYRKEPLPEEEEGKTNILLSYLFLIYRFRVLLIISAVLSLLSVPAFIFFRIYRKKHPIS